jgi:thiamine biosynthesis protein ThiI
MEKGVLIAFSEIGLRSKNVRKQMIKLLVRNILNGLKWKKIDINEIKILWDRIIIIANNNLEIAKIISKIPGVRYAAPIYLIKTSNLEEIIEEISNETYLKVSDKKFKVETKRRYKELELNSMQISSLIGKKILEKCLEKNINTKVDLKNPDILVEVEIDKEYSLYYFERFEGYGGYPIGAQTPLVSLFSGGTDSCVATWLMMNRGCKIYPIFIDQSPFMGCCNIDRAIKVFQALRDYVLYPDMELAIVKVGKIMEKIIKNSIPKNICLHCKRTMYKIAEKYSEKVGAKGIVTGESVGQVASQTIDNLYVISQSINLPIYRPLAGMSKEMIHEFAKKIGIYDIAAIDIGYCDILPEHPTTKGKINEIIEEEKKMDLDKEIEEVFQQITYYKAP